MPGVDAIHRVLHTGRMDDAESRTIGYGGGAISVQNYLGRPVCVTITFPEGGDDHSRQESTGQEISDAEEVGSRMLVPQSGG